MARAGLAGTGGERAPRRSRTGQDRRVLGGPPGRGGFARAGPGGRRTAPGGRAARAKAYNDWYNAEFGGATDLPRQPWHDIAGVVQGPAAWDIVREFVGRWLRDPSFDNTLGDTSSDGEDRLKAKFDSLFAREDSPADIKPPTLFNQQYDKGRGGEHRWAAQVLRSQVRDHWEQDPPLRRKADGREEFRWVVHGDTERSILESYRLAIDQAEKFIYIETQYFIGSGKRWGMSSIANDLPERIVRRIYDRKARGLPFHAFIVCPMFPEGVPNSSAAVVQRLYEWRVMQYMVKAIGDDWRNYVSFYFPFQWAGPPGLPKKNDRESRVRAGMRYMIYVHSKLIIVDDRYILFGSANLNERSLAGGRDSEIGIAMWPQSRAEEQACIEQLRKFRVSLFKEHWGTHVSEALMLEPHLTPSALALQGYALANYIAMRRGLPKVGLGSIMSLPLVLEQAFEDSDVGETPDDLRLPERPDEPPPPKQAQWQMRLRVMKGAIAGLPKNGGVTEDEFIPDPDAYDDEWRWWSPGDWLLVGSSLPE